ncbi:MULTISPECIES: class I SAM-dependent methyltransferase [Ferrimicrobium]|uniref:Methyltransferase domain-containing protein n=1 Tax=Ferrimicrobium acidiphilum TaxID=121039 RepID=A0ABV3Y5L2_9ACTN|nr:methyltransferase domain-containing protein [Ferrimicrobium sp.]MCL5973942.1 class I SAM-dependent methyltransferase [Actinomycetota bacterium]
MDDRNQHQSTTPPRWLTDHEPGHSEWYVRRFRTLAAQGADLEGEARLLDAILPRHARVLDAGCGPGRVSAALFARGHQVVGVDVDPILIAAAKEDHPGPTWIEADLATMDLVTLGEPEPFDAAILAGNVMTFIAVGTGAQVLQRVANHLKPKSPVAVGFGLDRGYALTAFDQDLAEANLSIEHRFATWDLKPWSPTADFVVTIARTP